MPMSSSTTSGRNWLASRRRASRRRGHVRTSWPSELAAAAASDLGRVAVVVDDQDRAGARGPRPRRSPAERRDAALRARRGGGSRTTNSLPWPEPVAARLDRAAVQLDQPLHQRQARCRGRPATRSSAGRPARTSRRRAAASSAAMPMPVSLHRRSRRRRRRAAPRSAMRPPRSRVLGGVVEQVGEHLRRRTGSASSETGSAGSVDASARVPRASMSGRRVSTARVDDAARARRAPCAARSCRA